MNKVKFRIFKSRLLFVLVCVLSGITAIPLVAILGEVLIKGWDQLGWSFLTEATPNAYKAMIAAQAGEDIPGGIANGIIGTFLMLFLAAVVAIPVGILCGICLSEYRKSWFATFVSYLTDLLQGTPSIIIGIITYIWVVVPMKGYSAIAGSVALFIMMLPLIIRSTEETHHDAAADYPFYGRDDEGVAGNLEGGRSCTGGKLLACDAESDGSRRIGKYLYGYPAGHLACGR